MRRTAAVAICLSSVLATGCLDIEQSLTLERDMSGKAAFSMKVNMEPMVGFIARMTRGMEGKTGEPTAEELAAAKNQLLQSSQSMSQTSFEDGKKELQSKLPAGITLLDAKFQQDELKMAADFAFGFDDVSKLKQIAFPNPGNQGRSGGPGNPVQDPFKDLSVLDEGATILITGPVLNPVADQTAMLPPDPETRKQIEEMLGSLRIAFKITAPFTVVESTAHRREGNTLIWEYNIKSIEKMTPEQTKQGISVRYRK